MKQYAAKCTRYHITKSYANMVQVNVFAMLHTCHFRLAYMFSVCLNYTKQIRKSQIINLLIHKIMKDQGISKVFQPLLKTAAYRQNNAVFT